MTPLEFLLRDGGWAREKIAIEMHFGATYEFISSIKIEDWEKYQRVLLRILDCMGELEDMEDIHNAPRRCRILAHAKVRGYKG